MKKLLLAFIVLSSLHTINAQQMNLKKLGAILTRVSDSIQHQGSQWNFKIKDQFFICVADSTHNRMRIISPISNSDAISKELKEAALIANFHTALDVKYAISDSILWCVFIHPLKELTEEQVLDAISQVYYGNVNFGTTFSSTSLVFPGKTAPKVKSKKEKTILEKI